MEALSVTELLAVDYGLKPIIDEGLLVQESSMLVVGPTEVGKSYFVLQMALDLAAGRPFLGRWAVTRPFRVLLVQAEVGRSRFQDRVRKFSAHYDSPDNLRLATQYTLKIDESSGHEALGEVLSEHGIEVLILDPMRPFHTGDENSSKDMERLFHSLRQYQQSSSLAIVITHHERKPFMGFSGGDKYEARGSSLITDRPDTVLRLAPTKNPNIVTLTFEKLRNADESSKPGPFKLEKSKSGLFHLVGSGTKRDEMMREAAELIGDGMPYAQFREGLMEQYGITDRTAKRWADTLEAEGALVREATGGGRKVVKRVRDTAEKVT